jgi:tetratricopeptide (TPR) repeat protein
MSNAKPLLKQAITLAKEGKRQEAGRVVRAVLKQDPNNIDAWWMMANLLEDRDKALKCVEKVLEINPNHRPARKKLQELRPERGSADMRTTQEIMASDAFGVDEPIDLDWSKLRDDPANAPEPKRSQEQDLRIVTFSLLGIAGLIAFAVLLAFWLYLTENPNPPPDVVAERITTAVIQRDADRLSENVCDEYREDYIAQINAFESEIETVLQDEGLNIPLSSIDFDTSGLEYRVTELGFRQATVETTGELVISINNFSVPVNLSDLDDVSTTTDLRVQNSAWVYCDPVE